MVTLELCHRACASCATILSAVIALAACAAGARAQPSFVEFESDPVRPLVLSADGSTLYACNIPDDRLEIFDVGPAGISHRVSVPVGMEPVAVAERSPTEVWVVNQLSDSVSIVDVAADPPRVTRTLLVGDEPRDIVFAANGRAFITTAHRGEQRVDPSLDPVPGLGSDIVAGRADGDPQLATPGVGRADVWVFDPAQLGTTVGGTPVGVVTLFGDTPRALAVDGNTVYAAIFKSGNQTATVSEGIVCNGFQPSSPCDGDGITSPSGLANGRIPGGNPGPATNYAGVTAPETGLIVRFDEASGQWRDGLERNFSNGVRFFLPDLDVFAIDANTLAQTQSWAHVGTVLFNMAVNPANQKLYVSNVDSQNLTRFEGSGVFGGSTVQGDLARARITILSGNTVTPRPLNTHIDYSVSPALPGTADHSLATPLDMAFSSDGSTVYVAAFGSSKVGVIDTAALEAGTFDSLTASAGYIDVTGGGPAGLAIDETFNRLYVLTRFDDAVSVIDLGTNTEESHVPMYDPEPPEVVQGRPFLYDARATSSNGEASCSSCHVFGDMDQLAWDLGDPDADVTSNPIPINLGQAASNQNGGAATDEFHPMKGPMVTQTMKGLANHGSMHWRGDRSNGFFGIDSGQGPPFDSHLAFMNFIVATVSLNGRATMIDPADMAKLTDFAMALTLPPNPIRRLDDDLSKPHRQLDMGDPQVGHDFYFGDVGAAGGPEGHLADGVPNVPGFGFTCEGCHTLEPQNGYFGTDGTMSFEQLTQIAKIPQLRNMYQKVGMFGVPDGGFSLPGDFSHQGDQIRGFGYLHDGSVDTLFRFLQADVFKSASSGTVGFADDQQRRDVEAFLLAYDSDVAPIVGQQVTLDAGNAAQVGPRIDLLLARSSAPFQSKLFGGSTTECDLVAKAVVAGRATGYVRRSDGLFHPDDGGPGITDAQLRSVAGVAGQQVTYTCVPPGSGERMGIDRDEDTVPDGIDNCVAEVGSGEPDTDGDGIVDRCDNLCVSSGERTKLLSITPTSGQAGDSIQLDVQGLGSSYQVLFGGTQAAVSGTGGVLEATVPAGLAAGSQALVEVVNAEGCRSQEAVFLTVPQATGGCVFNVAPSSSSGGGMAFLGVVGLALWRRGRRAWWRCRSRDET